MSNLDARRAAQKSEALLILTTALSMKLVYNSDYNDAKQKLNYALEHEWEKAAPQQSSLWRSLYEADALHPYLHTLSAVKKRVAKLSGIEGLENIQALISEWGQIATDFSEAKQFVVKTRKPSGKERTTPERTLVNTGTCAVCELNVKLTGGRIYPHGFTLRWGTRNGECYGVGYLPWEKSTEGAVQYLAMLQVIETLKQTRLAEADRLTEITVRGYRGVEQTLFKTDANFARSLSLHKSELESEIRQLSRAITKYKTRIAEWEEKPLPG